MSSSEPGGGGFGDVPRKLPRGVTQEQLDDIKAFNAGLTRTGGASRPARSRGSGLNRGQGSGISPGRGCSYASTSSRTGSGVGYGGSASYSVGPSTPSPIAKTTTAREPVPTYRHGFRDVTKTRWANIDSTGPGALGTHSVGPVSSAAAPPKPRSRSPTRSSILTTQRSQPSPPKVLQQQQQQQPVFQPLQNVPQGQNPVTRIPTPPGRQRIVTNMTPNDPTKPWIPAHLQQKSSRQALEEISRMAGVPLSTVTSDGFSMPAHHPGGSATSLTSNSAMPGSHQVSVDATADTQNVVANQNLAENTGNSRQTLVDSRWAPAATVAPQNSFASDFTASPIPAATSGWGAPQPTEATQAVPVNNTWGTASTAPAASGWAASVPQALPASQSGVANNGTGWDTVGINRWTQGQPQPVSAADALPSTQNAGFGSNPVQAHPSNTSDWGAAPAFTPATLARPSGHARVPSDVEMTGATSILDEPISNLDLLNGRLNQMLMAMPTMADSRWADPNLSGSSHAQASASSSTHAVETGRQALSETAPSGFPYDNTQNQASTTNSFWPPTDRVQPVAHPQTEPFLGFNAADFNRRITAELQQTDMLIDVPVQSSQPVDSGPAQVRHAPQNTNRAVPSVSTENAPPKRVQYLKDSRWAH